jgi:hypothetical protein
MKILPRETIKEAMAIVTGLGVIVSAAAVNSIPVQLTFSDVFYIIPDTGQTLCYNNSDIAFGRAMGYMGGIWGDVHGAGAQRSDPKDGNPGDYPFGRGPREMQSGSTIMSAASEPHQYRNPAF